MVAIMHHGVLAVHGTLDAVLATRPARISVDLDPQDGDRLIDRTPEGVSASWDSRRRPSESSYRVLDVVSEKQQYALTWLVSTASELGMTLGPLRASPASLDEVFHHVRNSSPDTFSQATEVAR